MDQRLLLLEVSKAVEGMPPERKIKIYEARGKLQEVISFYGEDGQMALALLGLEFAAKAEAEEEQEKIVNAVIG
jgi:hypothetical protein